MTSASDNNISIDPNGTGNLTLGSADNATTAIAGNAVNIDAAGALSLDAAAASNLTVTTGAADGKDLTISVNGGGDSSLLISSDGSGIDAIDINATQGSMLIAKSLTDGKTLKLGNSNSTIMEFKPNSNAPDENITLTNVAGNALNAIDINATAGGIDIDAAKDITLTTTTSSGEIQLVSAHTAGRAVHIDANAHAGSIVDIDAGVLDIDVTGASTIDAASITYQWQKSENGDGVNYQDISSATTTTYTCLLYTSPSPRDS